MFKLLQLNLSINSGEIFGLVGPNAAGKSTSIRLLAGIIRPDSGKAHILGLDLFSSHSSVVSVFRKTLY